MTRLAMVLLIGLVVTSCRGGGRWAWVEDEVVTPARCRGGTVATEKRTTDVTVTGHTRNTVIRSDACLD